MITDRVTLDVPLQLVIKVSNLPRKRRKELGTRNGTRSLTCCQQAVFVLAWFRDRPRLSRLGHGFGISQATAYRYKDEGVEVLGHLAPTLHDILEKAAEQGLPYLILDGTLIASDRCAYDVPLMSACLLTVSVEGDRDDSGRGRLRRRRGGRVCLDKRGLPDALSWPSGGAPWWFLDCSMIITASDIP